MDKALGMFKTAYEKFIKKNGNLILILGLLGLGLILLSEFWPKSAAPKTVTQEDTTPEKKYITETEGKLTDILSKTAGVGKVQVLITLETGVENIYATEKKSNVNVSTGDSSGNQQTSDNEDTIIIVRDQSGGESPVLVKSLPPRIQGVAVVCEGADSALVRQRVLETVTTVLDISSAKVCITKKQ